MYAHSSIIIEYYFKQHASSIFDGNVLEIILWGQKGDSVDLNGHSRVCLLNSSVAITEFLLW